MKHKLIALLLILLLVSSLAISAFAEAESEEIVVEDGVYGIRTELDNGLVTVIDPLYEGELEPEDMAVPTVSARPKLKAKLSSSASTVTVAADAKEAGELLREQFKNRVATITFKVNTTTEVQSELEALQLECYYAAFTHTGVGNEGDYLRGNQGGYSYYKPISVSDGVATFTIAPTYYSTAEQEEAVTEEVTRLVESFGFSEETSDYDKIRGIYDYLCQNITYDDSAADGTTLRHTTYAALIKKSAVCQGYATAFYRLALECGLSARYITGTGTTSSGTENHGWNIVELEDAWYYVDATWDAARWEQGVGYIYFLRGSKEGEFPNHTAGVNTSGNTVELPDEMEYLSEESYAIPLEIMQEPQDKTVYWGDVPTFRVGAIGKDLTYAWTVRYGNGGRGNGSSAGYKMASKTGITASNRDTYDGTTLYCTITDGAGNSLTTRTATLTVQDPVGEIAGYTLSFAGDIAINFYMKLSEDVLESSAAHMHFTIPGETEKEVDIPVSEAKAKTFTVEGEKVTYYRFTAGVAAKDMTQSIHAEFYYDDSYKTDEMYYTVKDYADYIQDHPEIYSDTAIAMVQAMLNYGGYAQLNFDYHTDEMANADLEDTSLPDEVPSECAFTASDAVEGITFKGAQLILRTNTVIRLYYVLEGDPEDYTVTVDGETVTPVSSSMGENWYAIDISGIPANKLDHAYAVVVENSDSESYEVDYSAYSNAYSVVANPDAFTENEVNMLKALYQFGEKTKAYFSK